MLPGVLRMDRRMARQAALELVFEVEFYDRYDIGEQYDLAERCRNIEQDAYLQQVVYGVNEHLAEIDEKITSHAVGWTTDRMSKVSLAIMRVAVYEMLYMDEIPFTVSINEAVELSKKFDHDKAPKFINGILNAVADAEGLKSRK